MDSALAMLATSPVVDSRSTCLATWPAASSADPSVAFRHLVAVAAAVGSLFGPVQPPVSSRCPLFPDLFVA